jgi:hypothetical protein
MNINDMMYSSDLSLKSNRPTWLSNHIKTGGLPSFPIPAYIG